MAQVKDMEGHERRRKGGDGRETRVEEEGGSDQLPSYFVIGL